MLSEIDKKILVNISENSKVSLKDLSSNIKISRETINKYINNLIENKIILHHTLRLNLANFSIASYTLLIKFSKYEDNKIEDIIKYICELNYTHMIAKIGGEYDLYVGFSIKQISDIDIFIESIYTKFPQFIKKHLIYTDIKHYKSDISCILSNKIKGNLTSRKYKNNLIRLDEIDKKILFELVEDSRQSLGKISAKINVPVTSILYRIKKLEKNEIILGYRSMLNTTRLDKQVHYVFFDINLNNLEIKNQMIKYLINHSKIIYFIKMVGTHSYQCLIHSSDNYEFHNILNELKANILGMENISIIIQLDLVYHNYLPNGFLD